MLTGEFTEIILGLNDMRLIDIEREIKAEIEKDRSSPQVYESIYKLLYQFMVRKKLLNSIQDYEEVSHIGATNLYLKIVNGDNIRSWIGYINLSHISYINQYKRWYRSELIETENNPDLADAVTIMSASSALQNSIDLETAMNLIYMEKSIRCTVIEILNKSKYRDYTKEYYDAMASILLSILGGRFMVYGSKVDKVYIHMLYELTKERIIKYIGQGGYNFEDVLRQYTMESIGINCDVDV